MQSDFETSIAFTSNLGYTSASKGRTKANKRLFSPGFGTKKRCSSCHTKKVAASKIKRRSSDKTVADMLISTALKKTSLLLVLLGG